jgi:hypothetical protein
VVSAARRLASGAGLAAVLSLLAPRAAHACAVCYGAASDPMIEGTRWSIVFLLVLTYLLLGGGAALFVLARRSSRARGRVPAPDPRTAPRMARSDMEARMKGLV